MGFFMLCAVISAVFAFSFFSIAQGGDEDGGSSGPGNRFVLREHEGYVAIFVENDPKLPMTVTDICVSTLRELDKQILETGMKVESHQELMMVLEDLGS